MIGGQRVKTRCVCIFFLFDSLHPYQQFFSYVRTGLPGLTQYLSRINVFCSRAQHSDFGEARTHIPAVLSQALYHWATALNRGVL